MSGNVHKSVVTVLLLPNEFDNLSDFITSMSNPEKYEHDVEFREETVIVTVVRPGRKVRVKEKIEVNLN